MFQKISLNTIIDKLIKPANPLQIIISIDIFLTIITEQLSEVFKHAFSKIFSDRGGGTEVWAAVALDQLCFTVRINHDVPTQDDEGVHAALHLVVTCHRSHADDGVDRQQQFLPLLFRCARHDEVAEFLLVQHTLVHPFRVVLLHSVVGQIDKLVVGVDVEFFRGQTHLKALVNPGHQWRWRCNYCPYSNVVFPSLLQQVIFDVLLHDLLSLLVKPQIEYSLKTVVSWYTIAPWKVICFNNLFIIAYIQHKLVLLFNSCNYIENTFQRIGRLIERRFEIEQLQSNIELLFITSFQRFK